MSHQDLYGVITGLLLILLIAQLFVLALFSSFAVKMIHAEDPYFECLSPRHADGQRKHLHPSLLRERGGEETGPLDQWCAESLHLLWQLDRSARNRRERPKVLRLIIPGLLLGPLLCLQSFLLGHAF